MKQILIYQSKTGYTKKYVDCLSRRIADLEIVEAKKMKWRELKNYDFIFYGAPLRNNKILGLDKFLKHYEKFKDKNIFIFATGFEPISDSKKENVILANALNYYHVRLYLLPGGLNFSKFPKVLQKIIAKGLKEEAKKQNLPEEQVLNRIDNPIDMTDMNSLDKMLDVYHALVLKGK